MAGVLSTVFHVAGGNIILFDVSICLDVNNRLYLLSNAAVWFPTKQ
jgi:hypothetical protein